MPKTKTTNPITKHVMVVMDCHWADAKGFQIFTREEWAEISSRVARLEAADKFPTEIYYGTNEYFEIESEEHFHSVMKVSAITDEEVAVFEKFFPRGYKGALDYGFPIPDFEDECEELDDEEAA